MRSDPSTSGGLFIGRRPGAAPVHYGNAPQPVSATRTRVDGFLAAVLLVAIAVLCLLCRGPIPVAGLWLGSRANYLTGNVEAGIVVSFGTAFAALLCNLALLRRLDGTWILVRRAAGHDQRGGALARIFAFAAVIGVVAFSFWFLVILGPNDPNL
ncbi:MAG TPA: hypothetical protein VGN13_06935 [Solirubrobacteraceae bacterium]|jgi:hypothetical protein